MTEYKTNRPWFQSFDSAIKKSKRNHDDIKISESGLDQVHKLARNYIASLDVGGSNMQVVAKVDSGYDTTKMTGKEKYLEWVRNWKRFYRELSDLIRYYKKEDRNELFRLKETAQVMLNARHVGKLASWAIVQRTKRLNAT
jgi:hypothetical protein